MSDDDGRQSSSAFGFKQALGRVVLLLALFALSSLAGRICKQLLSVSECLVELGVLYDYTEVHFATLIPRSSWCLIERGFSDEVKAFVTAGFLDNATAITVELAAEQVAKVLLQLRLLDERSFVHAHCITTSVGALAAVRTLAERGSVISKRVGTFSGILVVDLAQCLEVLFDGLEMFLLQGLVRSVRVVVGLDGMDKSLKYKVTINVEKSLEELIFVVDVVQLYHKCAQLGHSEVKLHLLLCFDRIYNFLCLLTKFRKLFKHSI